jgi:hypothetical protein
MRARECDGSFSASAVQLELTYAEAARHLIVEFFRHVGDAHCRASGPDGRAPFVLS